MSLNIVMSISIAGPGGMSRELSITEEGDVFYRVGGGSQINLEKRRRDVDDFIWEVEGFVAGWDKRYGEGSATEPGGWMVLVEKDRTYTRYRGCDEYPEDWESFVELVDEFIAE